MRGPSLVASWLFDPPTPRSPPIPHRPWRPRQRPPARSRKPYVDRQLDQAHREPPRPFWKAITSPGVSPARLIPEPRPLATWAPTRARASAVRGPRSDDLPAAGLADGVLGEPGAVEPGGGRRWGRLLPTSRLVGQLKLAGCGSDLGWTGSSASGASVPSCSRPPAAPGSDDWHPDDWATGRRGPRSCAVTLVPPAGWWRPSPSQIKCFRVRATHCLPAVGGLPSALRGDGITPGHGRRPLDHVAGSSTVPGTGPEPRASPTGVRGS